MDSFLRLSLAAHCPPLPAASTQAPKSSIPRSLGAQPLGASPTANQRGNDDNDLQDADYCSIAFYLRPPEDLLIAAAGLVSSYKDLHDYTIQGLSELPHGAFGALARQVNTTL